MITYILYSKWTKYASWVCQARNIRFGTVVVCRKIDFERVFPTEYSTWRSLLRYLLPVILTSVVVLDSRFLAIIWMDVRPSVAMLETIALIRNSFSVPFGSRVTVQRDLFQSKIGRVPNKVTSQKKSCWNLTGMTKIIQIQKKLETFNTGQSFCLTFIS